MESKSPNENVDDAPLRARESCVENKHSLHDGFDCRHLDSLHETRSGSFQEECEKTSNSFDSAALSVDDDTIESLCKVRSFINAIPEGHRRGEAIKALETIIQILEENGGFHDTVSGKDIKSK